VKSENSLLIDVIKALASQLIIWHHLAVYSPMSDVLYPHATGLTDWLYEDARLAVQAFLVLGGFLAARSLAPRPDALSASFAGGNLVRVLWSRYLRLARPYFVALGGAVVCATVARALVIDPETPAAPSMRQLLAHLFLLQDIVNMEALSAGVWYVAVDFQLYAAFALLLWLAHRVASRTGIAVGTLVVGITIVLSAVSLFWLNRNPALDEWGYYFFGSYSLGIFAHWAAEAQCRSRCLPLIALLTMVALLIDWRSRILVAGLTALVLAGGVGAYISLRGQAARLITGLGRISYPVFLVHYPVLLVVGAVVSRYWPTNTAINAVGLFVAWMLSLGAGMMLHHWVERKPQSSRTSLMPTSV
jgi:peptidoglycan/LPS O-acetylase OafA/YrhL